MARPDTPDHGVPFGEALRVWARIALLSFGGPAGQIAVMHRIVVEEKRWIGETRFLHALNYCMLLPGPEAQQLAVYIGWLMHRGPGGLVAGILFVLPGAVAIMALSIIYALYGAAGPVQALFFGLKAAVLAIVVQAVIRIGGRALRNRAMVGLAAAAFLAIFVAGVPFPWIIAAAALAGYLGHRAGLPAFQPSAAAGGGPADTPSRLGDGVPDHCRPSARRLATVLAIALPLWALPVVAAAAILGPGNVLAEIGLFFSRMAVVTFGGAYAVLAYVAQEAVQAYGWLQPGEMLDGLGMAETTPGPLIMVLQFVGFMAAFRAPGALDPFLAGIAGGLMTTWVTFVPCFLFIFAGGPYIEALRGNRALGAALSAVTAAVVGVILNLSLWFALHSMFGEVRAVRPGLALELPVWSTLDPWAAGLGALAMIALFRVKLGFVATLAGCAALGIALHLAGLR